MTTTSVETWSSSCGTATASPNDHGPNDNTYAWIMRLADGLVVDGIAFYDSISFNDLWTRIPA